MQSKRLLSKKRRRLEKGGSLNRPRLVVFRAKNIRKKKKFSNKHLIKCDAQKLNTNLIMKCLLKKTILNLTLKNNLNIKETFHFLRHKNGRLKLATARAV